MVLVGEHIKNISPYKPGKPISEVVREYGLSKVVKLASNENPLGPNRVVVDAIKKATQDINIYPDGSAYYLKEAIVKCLDKYSLNMNQIVVGNGSNEIIELALRAFAVPGEEVILSEQAFAIYEIAAQACNLKPVMISQTEDFVTDMDKFCEAVSEKTKIVCFVNPNNPTGTYYDKDAFDKFLNKVSKDTILILDEAYFEYADADDFPNSMDYMDRHPNMVICRTFSKIHGMAGVRLGYAVTTPELADYINRVRAPFNVNLLALEAGIAALSDESKGYVEETLKLNAEGKRFFEKSFEKLGLKYLPSQTNFFLLKVGDKPESGNECYNFLLREGVVVRPMNGYGFPEWIRVNTGTMEEDRIFIEELNKFITG